MGSPIDGTEISIIDHEGRSLGVGQSGEIVIVGNSVSRGYHNKPDLNAERFIFLDGKPAYRTGDLGTLNADRSLMYQGRADRQVKFNGHRIELEEIEIAANRSGLVETNATTLFESAIGRKSLVMFVVPKANIDFDASALKTDLRKQLPGHMIPSRILTRQSIPMTGAGKVNSARLVAELQE